MQSDPEHSWVCRAPHQPQPHLCTGSGCRETRMKRKSTQAESVSTESISSSRGVWAPLQLGGALPQAGSCSLCASLWPPGWPQRCAVGTDAAGHMDVPWALILLSTWMCHGHQSCWAHGCAVGTDPDVHTRAGHTSAVVGTNSAVHMDVPWALMLLSTPMCHGHRCCWPHQCWPHQWALMLLWLVFCSEAGAPCSTLRSSGPRGSRAR